METITEIVKNQGKSLLLFGIGGIGKTSLAMAFANSIAENYNHIIWVNQTNSFEASIIDDPSLVENLGMELPKGSSIEKTKFVFNQISNLNGSVLFIVDDANEQVQPYIKLFPKNCSTIICSRLELPCDEKISVEFLEKNEALSLFKKFYTRDKDEEMAMKIVELVDYHTLSIELIAKTAQVLRITPLQDLLSQLKESGIKINRSSDIRTSHSKDSNIKNIFSYLCTIFEFGSHNENEKTLLKQFAVFPSKFISYSELEEIFLLREKPIEIRDKIIKGIESLKSKGLLVYNEAIDGYKMHMVIQEVVIEKLQPGFTELSELIEKLTDLTHYDNTNSEHKFIEKIKWYSFGERFASLFFEEHSESFTFLLNRLGSLASISGKYNDGEKFLTQALKIAKKILGEENEKVAIYYSELAIIYSHVGDYEKAIEFTEQALKIEEIHYEDNHIFIAIRCANLTSFYRNVGSYDKARDYGIRALDISLKNFSPEDPRVAVCQSELGLVYKDSGHFDKAKELLKQALESDKINYEQSDPRVANRKSNLGMVYRDLKEYDKAFTLVKESLDSDVKVLGEKDPGVIIRKSNLGMILKDMGKAEDAKLYLVDALSTGKTVFSDDNPRLAQIKINLGSILFELKEMEDALEIITPALKVLENSLGSEHKLTIQAVKLRDDILSIVGESSRVK